MRIDIGGGGLEDGVSATSCVWSSEVEEVACVDGSTFMERGHITVGIDELALT